MKISICFWKLVLLLGWGRWGNQYWWWWNTTPDSPAIHGILQCGSQHILSGLLDSTLITFKFYQALWLVFFKLQCIFFKFDCVASILRPSVTICDSQKLSLAPQDSHFSHERSPVRVAQAELCTSLSPLSVISDLGQGWPVTEMQKDGDAGDAVCANFFQLC